MCHTLTSSIKMRTVQRYTGRGCIAPASSRTVKKRPITPHTVDNRSTNTLPASAPDETWKSCPGFEDQYQISSHGRLFSIGTDRIIPLSIDQNGFGCLWVKQAGTRKKWHLCIHLTVAMAFLPTPDGLPVVKHIDGNPLNNAASNLRWAVMPALDIPTPTHSTLIGHE